MVGLHFRLAEEVARYWRRCKRDITDPIGRLWCCPQRCWEQASGGGLHGQLVRPVPDDSSEVPGERAIVNPCLSTCVLLHLPSACLQCSGYFHLPARQWVKSIQMSCSTKLTWIRML